MINDIYYCLKPLIPRSVQISLRRKVIQKKRLSCSGIWPIYEGAGKIPENFPGWPDNKRFALILTHDVETLNGHDKCRGLMKIEQDLGFVSSFSFVPLRYEVSPQLRRHLVKSGYEVAVHGLYHDGKYKHKNIFKKRAVKINNFLKEWDAVGFRFPAMQTNLDWIHDLNIEYDSSTFDTDPFEPNSKGIGTIFPFWKYDQEKNRGYIEIPYTLPQDFTLFILLKEQNIDIWKRKLDWIVEKGGMALINTHPDYMNFGDRKKTIEEYPVKFYSDFLEYVTNNYGGQYWHALPKDLARYYRAANKISF